MPTSPPWPRNWPDASPPTASISARVSFERRGDLRYVGQGYELRVPFPDGAIDAAALAKVFDAFHEIHRREYGHHFADSAIEIVNLRLVGAASAATIAKPTVGTATSLEAAKVRTGTCTFRVDGKLADYPTTFYRRDLLPTASASPAPPSCCRWTRPRWCRRSTVSRPTRRAT